MPRFIALGASPSSPSTTEIANAAKDANDYLFDLSMRFGGFGFDLYTVLGQRNLSGFVGEVFARFAATRLTGYQANPHPDGRPDLIDVSSPESRRFLKESCYALPPGGKGEPYPMRKRFAPYPHGGIEVKATIGSLRGPASSYVVGQPRARDVSSLTFWGHHTACRAMLGVYYDYFPDRNAAPQVAAVFYLDLDGSDWNEVSIGEPGSKKTSNTALNADGRAKLRSGLVAYLDSRTHIETLKRVGALPP